MENNEPKPDEAQVRVIIEINYVIKKSHLAGIYNGVDLADAPAIDKAAFDDGDLSFADLESYGTSAVTWEITLPDGTQKFI